jgi:hypothetical protein
MRRAASLCRSVPIDLFSQATGIQHILRKWKVKWSLGTFSIVRRIRPGGIAHGFCAIYGGRVVRHGRHRVPFLDGGGDERARQTLQAPAKRIAFPAPRRVATRADHDEAGPRNRAAGHEGWRRPGDNEVAERLALAAILAANIEKPVRNLRTVHPHVLQHEGGDGGVEDNGR